jgi:hypothetical protein
VVSETELLLLIVHHGRAKVVQFNANPISEERSSKD